MPLTDDFGGTLGQDQDYAHDKSVGQALSKACEVQRRSLWSLTAVSETLCARQMKNGTAIFQAVPFFVFYAVVTVSSDDSSSSNQVPRAPLCGSADRSSYLPDAAWQAAHNDPVQAAANHQSGRFRLFSSG